MNPLNLNSGSLIELKNRITCIIIKTTEIEEKTP
jgi:hypothetical protein